MLGSRGPQAGGGAAMRISLLARWYFELPTYAHLRATGLLQCRRPAEARTKPIAHLSKSFKPMITVQGFLDQSFRAVTIGRRKMIGSKALLCETGKTDKRYQRPQRQSAEVDCRSHEFSLKESNEPLQILEDLKRDHLPTGNASTLVISNTFKL